MQLVNVRLILAREIRDQLRDRRTLFMMLVLPILLYPLLGMSYFQVMQFMQVKPTRVLVVGAGNVPDDPPLVVNNRFAADLFEKPENADLLELDFFPAEPQDGRQPLDPREEARRAVKAGRYDAAIYFPDDFARALELVRRTIEERGARQVKVPQPEIIYTTANETSQITFARLSGVLNRWADKVADQNLIAGGISISAAQPFDIGKADIAGETAYRGAALWSKILPVILLIWALTGAFYPAIDLCAGEKERGTLETLLCSPARRSEIVLGKLLTIMLFSMMTAILNLLSIGATGWLVFRDMKEFSMPPAISALWLLAALVPVSALFSALCLALAAFARSTKEGQYYLMPLLLVTMPLVVLPMTPGVELNLGNSLIPVTGIVLLLRHLIEGDTLPALQHLPVVIAVTLAACWFAVRWAIDQFNSESVLFRESERLDLGLWLRRLVRDRRATPSVAAAFFCGVVVLAINVWVSGIMPENPGGFVALALISQLLVILAPMLVLMFLLTRSPRQTLSLRRPPWPAVPGAICLALVLHPALVVVQAAIRQLYPISSHMLERLEGLEGLIAKTPLWELLLLGALLPAVCEELVFRGFILSGLRRLGHKWWAIVLSAVFFGLAHPVLQQSLSACLAGIVIGYVVVQTGSILPGIIFHLTHNSLMLAYARITPEVLERWPSLGSLLKKVPDDGYAYHWQVVAVGVFAACLILARLTRLDYPKSKEEKLQEAIRRGLHDDGEHDMIRALP